MRVDRSGGRKYLAVTHCYPPPPSITALTSFSPRSPCTPASFSETNAPGYWIWIQRGALRNQALVCRYFSAFRVAAGLSCLFLFCLSCLGLSPIFWSLSPLCKCTGLLQNKSFPFLFPCEDCAWMHLNFVSAWPFKWKLVFCVSELIICHHLINRNTCTGNSSRIPCVPNCVAVQSDTN